MSYETLANVTSLEKVKAELTKRNFEPILVENRAEALEKIKELIPQVPQ